MTEAMLVSPLSLSTDRSLNINGIVARDYFLILAKINISSGWRPGCILGIEYLQSGSTLAEILSSVPIGQILNKCVLSKELKCTIF